MQQLKEYRYLIVMIFLIFGTLLLGAIFSQSFTQQRTYLELFMLLGAVLFIFSMLVVFTLLGASSFALYMAIMISAVMLLYGIEGALLVTVMTYSIWGLVFSIELLLVDNGVQSAMDWFRQRYNFKSFLLEYYAFYPMIYLFYIIIELLPNLIHGEETKRFSPHEIVESMKQLLGSDAD